MQQIGIFQWYSTEKGYGVISTIDSTIEIQNKQDKSIDIQKYNEVFIHITNWLDKSTIDLTSNPLPLVFDVIFERGKITAKQCRYFNYSLEDFKLLYELTIQHRGKLAITIKPNNKSTKLVNIIFKQNPVSFTHFNTVLENKFYQVTNDNFFDFIEKLYKYFDKDFIANELIQKNASIRAQETPDDNFFIFELWEKGFLNTDDLTLEIIKENILKFNITLFKKLISHPDVINIYKVLLEENNSELIYKLINYGMANDSLIEYAVLKVKKIISEIETKSIIVEASRLLKVLNNQSTIDAIVNHEIAIRLTKSDDSIFIFDSWEAGYIETLELKFVDIEKNIPKITLRLYEKLKLHPTIDKITWLLLSHSEEQLLLENIICDLENILEGDFEFKHFTHIIHNSLLNYSSENQVLFMKKLFHLRSLLKLEFTAEDMGVFLSEKVVNAINNYKQIVDVSTLLIANILYSFQNHGKFIAEKELIKTVLTSIGNHKSRKIQIDHYFDKCEGMGRLRISDQTNGAITKEQFITSNGEEQYYFKVVFDYIRDIVEAIRKIPGSRYNSDGRYWGVPLRHGDELMAFAKEHRFLINSENKFQDNTHLVEIYLDIRSKPADIEFCSGVETIEANLISPRKFWWCAGGKCYQNNIHLHSVQQWKEYTLYDFINILELSLEEKTKLATFPIGEYIKFVTILNRFQKLLERMYCAECGHILYPVEAAVAAYSVTRFSCENQQCGQHHEVIYLNHCLNGQCLAIIDSRESKKCKNGLYICNTCGSCCSHAMFERRKNNLLKNNLPVHLDLKYKIDNNLGHLEKAEYFCYKCGQWMQELSDTSYQCRDCNVNYDLSKYHYLKNIRINRELRDKNYPISPNDLILTLKTVLLDEKQSLEADGRNRGYIFGILFNKVVNIDGNEISLAMLNNRALTNEVFA